MVCLDVRLRGVARRSSRQANARTWWARGRVEVPGYAIVEGHPGGPAAYLAGKGAGGACQRGPSDPEPFHFPCENEGSPRGGGGLGRCAEGAAEVPG